jgi:hypothetical protein
MTVIKAALFKFVGFLMVMSTAVFFLTACHHKLAEVIAPTAPVAKNPDENSHEIPGDLYKTMPVYPGAQVVHVRKPKGSMREMLFEVKNAPPLNQMVSYYKTG